MSDSPNTSEARLEQLENMARARAEVGEANALQAAIPGLVTEIYSLRQQRDKLEAEKRVAVELINAENLTGEYVHELDEEGLLEQQVHEPPSEPVPEGSSVAEAVLHLYPLADEHGDAMVSGNPEGLRLLAGRIEQALADTSTDGYYLDHGYPDDPGQKLFAADGEQYHLAVERTSAGVHDEHWQARPEPYFVSRRRAREAGMNA